jgi:AraC-like DNA-binding protein
LIPFVAAYLLDFSYLGLSGLEGLTQENYANLPHTRIMFSLRIISPIIYSQWALAKVKAHQNHIKEEFSFSEKIDLSWLQFLCYSLIVINVFSIALVVFENIFSYSFIIEFNYYTLVATSFLLLGLIYYGLGQERIFKLTNKIFKLKLSTENEKIQDVLIDNKFLPSSLNKQIKQTTIHNSLKNRRNMEDIKIYEKRLYSAMEQKKLFLEPELSLAQLASNINMTSHLLSQVLNECIMMNFYDFVNSYRVIEMKSKLANRSFDKYNIVVLAYESGFNSKASFQRIFKNHTGLTPTEYKRHLLEHEAEVREIEMYASVV